VKILAVDIGTGTQDILLLDTRLDVENSLKLILPSPTMIVRRRIQQATQRRQALLLSGVMMGGGPCQWAAQDHLRAGLPVFATPDAARTFNDDLAAVASMGVKLVSGDEAARLPGEVQRIVMRDFDFNAIRRALEEFGVHLDGLAAVGVAVFDHGDAPPDESDRRFRFDYLDERIRAENRLSAFAYPAERIPVIMTRLRAVASSADGLPAPLVVMDTAPAAVLGATYDPLVNHGERCLVANVGNFHTLAFRLGPGGIEGVFEHHTGEIDRTRLEGFLASLAHGSLTNAEVFDSMGHGALVYNQNPFSLENSGPPPRLVVTGPRRSLLAGSRLHPYFAVPFGDMMTAGCIGLLSAAADCLPELREPVGAALRPASGGIPPWEIE